MDCPVCLAAFDLQKVRPKGLPCQHTVCQSCVGLLQQKCPIPMCRKAFEMPQPDNFSLVTHLEALEAQQPAEDCVGALDSEGSSSSAPADRRVKQGEPSGVHADAQQPAEDRIEELNLLNLSQSDPADQREDKAETLRLVRQRGVRRMTMLWCYSDPDWVLDVLRSAAPTLEELEVLIASELHVAAAHGMPRLQRLDLQAPLVKRPVELPALHRPSCLKWLRVSGLPRVTTVSLLRAHAASLDVLWLHVGSEPGEEWPKGCADLDALLGQCGLRLTRLVLWRVGMPQGSPCRAQLEAVRRVLPGCTVQCDRCDGVPDEGFTQKNFRIKYGVI